MDWKYRFTSFDGRIGRQQFWLGAIILLVASIPLGWLFVQLGLGMSETSSGTVNFDNGNSMQFSRWQSTLSPFGQLVLTLILLWPVVAISLKRRHDRGAKGYDVFAYWTLSLAGALLALMGLDAAHFLARAISFLTALLGVYLLVVMGFLKGTDGSNTYGPDPLHS